MSNINLEKTMQSLDIGRKLDAYTGVRIHVGQNASGKDITYSAGNSSGYVLEIENPIGTQQMAYAILAGLKLRSVRYQPFTAERAQIDPAAEMGDGVTVNGTSSTIMGLDTGHSSMMAATVSAPMDEEVDHEFKYEPKTKREFKREAAYTRSRLTINEDEIRAEVSRATGAETTLSASISVQADRITSEVARATNSETTLSSRITQTADAITSEVTRATGAEGQLSTQIAQRLDSITLSVSSAAGSSTFTIKDGSTTLDTKTLDLSVKAVNISGKLTVGQLSDGSVVISSKTETEYYLSTSSSSATGGSWSTTMPTWASGKYLWVRQKTTDTLNDNTTNVTYSPQNGRYDKNLTNALSTASSAQTSANSAITRERTIYYSIAAGEPTPSTPTEWVSDISGDQNKWTCKRPEYSQSYPVLYTASERISVGGVFSCSAVTRDLTTTVIDGGNIITGSITANKIAVTDLNAFGATIGGWSIGATTLRKQTDTTDIYFQADSNATANYNAIAVRTRASANDSWATQFAVTYGGKMTAKNADIEGKITATSGVIGGVTIANGTLSGITDTNIASGGISGGGGSGSIASGSLTGGDVGGSTLTTYNTDSGINTNLGYGGAYGAATQSAGGAADYFYANNLYATRLYANTYLYAASFQYGSTSLSLKTKTIAGVTINYLGY